MRIVSSPVFVRRRGLVCAVMIAFAAGTAVGWTAALPGAASPANGAALALQPDFDLVFASLPAVPRTQDRAKIATAVNFDLVFASFASPRSGNTPTQREKLRNAGWRRILQSANPKPTAARVSATERRLAVN